MLLNCEESPPHILHGSAGQILKAKIGQLISTVVPAGPQNALFTKLNETTDEQTKGLPVPDTKKELFVPFVFEAELEIRLFPDVIKIEEVVMNLAPNLTSTTLVPKLLENLQFRTLTTDVLPAAKMVETPLFWKSVFTMRTLLNTPTWTKVVNGVVMFAKTQFVTVPVAFDWKLTTLDVLPLDPIKVNPSMVTATLFEIANAELTSLLKVVTEGPPTALNVRELALTPNKRLKSFVSIRP
jgi:hypothetical protein